MFGIPGKQAVTLTPAAVRQIVRLMERQGASGLRIGVKKGGCAGMEYTMEVAQGINPMDELVEQDGARVMIAPMAQMFLFGKQPQRVRILRLRRIDQVQGSARPGPCPRLTPVSLARGIA